LHNLEPQDVKAIAEVLKTTRKNRKENLEEPLRHVQEHLRP
jgi:(p)ppGpp synthase/HD superfamily hydrolase